MDSCINLNEDKAIFEVIFLCLSQIKSETIKTPNQTAAINPDTKFKGTDNSELPESCPSINVRWINFLVVPFANKKKSDKESQCKNNCESNIKSFNLFKSFSLQLIILSLGQINAVSK